MGLDKEGIQGWPTVHGFGWVPPRWRLPSFKTSKPRARLGLVRLWWLSRNSIARRTTFHVHYEGSIQECIDVPRLHVECGNLRFWEASRNGHMLNPAAAIEFESFDLIWRWWWSNTANRLLPCRDRPSKILLYPSTTRKKSYPPFKSLPISPIPK